MTLGLQPRVLPEPASHPLSAYCPTTKGGSGHLCALVHTSSAGHRNHGWRPWVGGPRGTAQSVYSEVYEQPQHVSIGREQLSGGSRDAGLQGGPPHSPTFVCLLPCLSPGPTWTRSSLWSLSCWTQAFPASVARQSSS